MPNQATASKRDAAASATSFVKVVRALLRNPPRSAAAAAAAAAAPTAAAPTADKEDFNMAATHQIRKNRGPRTALDISGHHFAKHVQVDIGRTRNRRQHLPLVSEPADSDAESLPDTVIQRRQQQQQQQQQQQSGFFDLPEEDRGLFSSSSSSRTWPSERDVRGGHADGDKPSPPRSSRASSTASTLPPSPDAAGTAAAGRPRSERPPRVPKTARSRCATGTCRRQQQQQQQQQSSRAAFFA